MHTVSFKIEEAKMLIFWKGEKCRMNQRALEKVRENYRQLAAPSGLRLSEEDCIICGSFGGYQVIVHPTVNGSRAYYNTLTVEIAAKTSGDPISKQDWKLYTKEHKNVSSAVQNQYLIILVLKNIMKYDKLAEVLNEELQNLTSYLRLRGYENCCQFCGKTGEETSPCSISGLCAQLCPDCFQNVSQNTLMAQQESRNTSENMVGGIVGALLGTLIGVVCIIVLSQLGYVAALSGVVMAVCTLKGYELLGKKLSGKGIVICCVLMTVMTYVGDRLDWAIVVARELELDFISSYRLIPLFLQEQLLDSAVYWGNLVMVYLFLLLGAVPTVINILKDKKNEGKVSRL